MKRTPLYDQHIKLNGKIIDFGGWELPVEYTGIIKEHEAVRSAAGLFDVSHMGEFMVEGGGAYDLIQKLVTNDINNKADGQITYSPMCYENGTTVDDLLIYKLNDRKYMLVVNASNVKKDFEWMTTHLFGDVKITDMSRDYALLALQGPKAEELLQGLTDYPLASIAFYRFVPEVIVSGEPCLVSRSGYTGEDGFEIYTSPESAGKLWDILLATGADSGLVPAGLGARDSLRFEAGLPLYGHELSDTITPLEAGLDKFVQLEKADFIGKAALVEQSRSLARKLVGLDPIDTGVPRSGYKLELDGKEIGTITTGGYCPSLKKAMALALIDIAYSANGQVVDIMIRNKPVKATVTKVQNYAKKYKR